VPTRRHHSATAKDRCFHSRTQTKRILDLLPVLSQRNDEIAQNRCLWSKA
jgi:hypothetical protein